MSTPLHHLSVREMQQGLVQKRFSSVELVETFKQRCEVLDTQINALISNDYEACLATARAADKAIASGQQQALTGVPIIVKDIYCVQDRLTSCGSKMLSNFKAPYDATVISKLKQQQVPILAKANMDEFAMGSTTETSYYGATRNPWNLKAVPGGSSGGSAAAVAARLSPVSIGTDTGGSIRQPAACCGLTGIKPTYGVVSRWGQIAFASSLDQGGAFGASAWDCAFVLDAISGFDEKDSTSINQPATQTEASLNEPADKGVIGVPYDLFEENLDNQSLAKFEQALACYQQLGYQIKRVSLKTAKLAVAAYYIIASAEASSNLSRYDGVRYGHRCQDPVDVLDLYRRSRSEGFGEEVKRRIMVGTYALSSGYYDAYYLQAQKVRRLITEEFRQLFQTCQVIAMPTKVGVALDLEANSQDPVSLYMEDAFTIPVNLAGLPGLSHPIGLNEQQLPYGLQLVGNYHQEAQILRIAHQFQQLTDYHQQIPPQFA